MQRLFGWIRRLFSPDPVEVPVNLSSLEEKIDYRFEKREFLIEALTHRSTLGELKPGEEGITYERLEFLGDSVLALITTEFLMRNFPDENEGQLTQKKSLLVSKNVLSKKADLIGLKDHVILSDNAFRGGVHGQDSIQTAVFEAVIGAVYMDGGLEPSRKIVENLVLDDIDEIIEHTDHINYKSHLQEWTQKKFKGYPKYRIKSTTGPEHDKLFLIEVKAAEGITGRGRGKSKKDAEQMAAKEALNKLRKIH
ncbi:MAG: ribonuclease III [Candidatus Krumholzibacteriota bacterium]|nr:ribonuclease III [Candidatus Krumholzibacteriota bacterium]